MGRNRMGWGGGEGQGRRLTQVRTSRLCSQQHERGESSHFVACTMNQLLRRVVAAPRSFAGVSHPFLSLSFSTDVRQAHATRYTLARANAVYCLPTLALCAPPHCRTSTAATQKR